MKILTPGVGPVILMLLLWGLFTRTLGLLLALIWWWVEMSLEESKEGVERRGTAEKNLL